MQHSKLHSTNRISTSVSEMNRRTCDLLFTRVLFLLVHLLILYVFCRMFVSLVWQYQNYDDSLRAMLYDRTLECTNISLVIDHILNQKNETAKQILMHITYITAMFVSMVIMLSRNFALILSYTLFFMTILGGNLVYPIVTPYLSMVMFVVSTSLSLTYVAIHLCVRDKTWQPATQTPVVI